MVSSSIMPHRFPFANSHHAPDEEMHESANDALQPPDSSRKRSASVLRRLHRIGDWLRRDDEELPRSQEDPRHQEQQELNKKQSIPTQTPGDGPIQEEQGGSEPLRRKGSVLGRTLSKSKSKRVVPELPRQFTFKRMNSEKRDRLMPVEPSATERRAVSVDRRPRGLSAMRRQSPPLSRLPSRSAPDVNTPDRPRSISVGNHAEGYFANPTDPLRDDYCGPLPKLSPFEPGLHVMHDDGDSELLDDRELQAELEAKWILNLSMQFRDKSDREKFFVTYAQEPNHWRRVTVSCDYRDAPPDSLESDLKSLRYQRDKSQRIYEAIRESLPDIQFYDTVTNLKLETEEGRLHVHVTEDINEIIPYPSTSLVDHVRCSRYRESELDFQSHLSGFVYKVSADDRIFIKKEIPGPDTVDEFLYEINALDALRGSKSVIQFHGIVVDEENELVKGLLISFASLGALVDIIYDYKSTDSLNWSRREKWAYQIIHGLSEIHEAGFVQGDFTLSNIVIDSDDNAKIIDINRRGCPIGWEPPELLRLIHSGQRISMCIGVKSDLYQLGMVLWALAENQDEPEHRERINGAMPHVTAVEVPEWFKGMIEGCLSNKPQNRPSAKNLLASFPPGSVLYQGKRVMLEASDHSLASRRTHDECTDPATIVNRDDIEDFKRKQRGLNVVIPSLPTTDQFQFADPTTSTGYRIESNGSYILPNRGRSPYMYPRSADERSVSSTTSISLNQEERPRWEHICPRKTPSYDNDDDESFPSYHDPGVEERPSVPDPPPFYPSNSAAPQRDYGRVSRWGKQRTSDLEGHVGDQPNQRVLFNPPLHQDSGFDEHMTGSLEVDDALQRPLQLNTSNHNLPPIHTTAAEASEGSQYISASARQSNISNKPAGMVGNQDTPQPPPTPATPFSYHTPLTSPIYTRSGQQNSDRYSSKTGYDPERPDSKYCPDPTDPHTRPS